MENNYLDNPYFEQADMYSLRLRDLIKKMSPMEWKAFEIIVASGVSEEKDAKEAFIKTMIDNGEPCKSEDTAWRIVKSLIKLGLYDAEKLFTGYRNFNVLKLTPVGVRIYRDQFRKEPPTQEHMRLKSEHSSVLHGYMIKYKHACDKKTVKKDWIENLVIKYTREMMMKDNVIEDIASIVFQNFQKKNPVIQLLNQRLSETETALNNLLKAIEEGIITSTTKQRMLELEQARDEINLKLIKEESKKPKLTKEGIVLWLRQIQAMQLETKEHKQRLIDIFVNAVYLYDDKLVIAFNYKDAIKTVSLKEVNGSITECAGVPKNREHLLVFSIFYLLRDSKNINAICRWHIAVTSANTGGYHNFCLRQKCKRVPSGVPLNRISHSGYPVSFAVNKTFIACPTPRSIPRTAPW